MAPKIDLYSLFARHPATTPLAKENDHQYLCEGVKGLKAYYEVTEGEVISIIDCSTGEVLMLTENKSQGLMHFDRADNKMVVDVVDVNGNGYKNRRDKGSSQDFDKMQALLRRASQFVQK